MKVLILPMRNGNDKIAVAYDPVAKFLSYL